MGRSGRHEASRRSGVVAVNPGTSTPAGPVAAPAAHLGVDAVERACPTLACKPPRGQPSALIGSQHLDRFGDERHAFIDCPAAEISSLGAEPLRVSRIHAIDPERRCELSVSST